MTPCQKLQVQEGTARRIESMQQSSSQCLLVPTVFGTVSSLHPINDFYTCIYYTSTMLSIFGRFHREQITVEIGLVCVVERN